MGPGRTNFIEGISVSRFLLVGFGPLLISWCGLMLYTTYRRTFTKTNGKPGEPDVYAGKSPGPEQGVELKESLENGFVQEKYQEDR